MYAQCWTGRESAKTFTSHSGVVIVVVDVVVVVVVVVDNGQHLIRIWMDGPGLDKTLNSLSVLQKLTKMDLMLPSIQLFRLRSLDFQ